MGTVEIEEIVSEIIPAKGLTIQEALKEIEIQAQHVEIDSKNNTARITWFRRAAEPIAEPEPEPPLSIAKATVGLDVSATIAPDSGIEMLDALADAAPISDGGVALGKEAVVKLTGG